MTAAVRFDDVSKQYSLGTGRTSLRELVSNLVKSQLHTSNGNHAANPVIWALRDLSFELEQGQAMGLIGPNGAGKTTVLKLLAGITRPSGGYVKINGRLSSLIELGAGFHPDLTGRENIALNASILGLSRQELRDSFDRIVAFSGLEKFLDTPVKRYSSGMYVRLGFSIAAHVEPDVLLVDEVFAVGDAQFRQRCTRRIQELQRNGATILFVSHNLFLIKSICDTALFLANGRVHSQGQVDQVIDSYEAWLRSQQAAGRDEHDPSSPDIDSSSVLDIERIEIHGLNGHNGDEFNFQDSAEVRIHYRCSEIIQNPNLVVRIVRGDGTTCCMIRTTDYGFSLDDLSGPGVITLRIDALQLAGGAYFIDALVNGDFDGMPLARENSPWFNVKGISLGHDETGGVYVPRVSWARVDRQR